MDVQGFWFAVLTLIFVSVPAFRYHAIYILFKARRFAGEHDLMKGALTERLIVASTGAVGSTMLALVGLNRIFGYPFWSTTSPAGFLLLIVALLLFSIPAFVWEYMYITGRLEK
jgi:hypothetical protein